MSSEIDFDETLDEYLIRTGGQTNEYGGVFQNGTAYSIDKKIEIRDIYLSKSFYLTHQPNLSEIASLCGVSRKFVRQIENELLSSGGNIEIPFDHHRQNSRGGFGSYTLELVDYWLILELHREEPTRSLRGYAENLLLRSGTVVSLSTIRRVLLHTFPFSSSLVVTSMIPLDKFRYENLIKAGEFMDKIKNFPINKLKFVDEKLLKNSEGLGRKTRKCPLTGVIPPIYTLGDFRNTYKMLGICGIDTRVSPLFFKIHKENNDSESYNEFILEVS